MKIIIFESHPDDLLFGPGPILLDWIEEGHDIHVITVTDGRQAIKYLGIPLDNHHLLNFHDADSLKYVEEGYLSSQS